MLGVLRNIKLLNLSQSETVFKVHRPFLIISHWDSPELITNNKDSKSEQKV